MLKRALRLSATHARAAAATAAILATMVGISLAPSSAMANENFCPTVTLAPYGQGGDRCWGTMQYMFGINMETHERAGCVDVANGSNGLLQSWTCVGTYNTAKFHYSPTIRRKGVVRNDNFTYTGVFGASEFW